MKSTAILRDHDPQKLHGYRELKIYPGSDAVVLEVYDDRSHSGTPSYIELNCLSVQYLIRFLQDWLDGEKS